MMAKTRRVASLLASLLLALLLWAPAPAAAQPAGLTLEVEKVLTGDVPPTAEEFTFSLTALNGGPLPADPTLAIEGEGTGVFAIAYAHPGTFYYQLRENAGTAEGYTYDDTVYDVTVVVTSDGSGALSASAVVSRDGTTTKEPRIVFENAYAAGDSPDGPGDPGGTDTPDDPNTPGTPGDSGTPDDSDTPDGSGTPSDPGDPGAPGTPGGGIPFAGEVALPIALIALVGLAAVALSRCLRASAK